MKQKNASCMRSGRRPSPEGTRLLFDAAISPIMMRPGDGPTEGRFGGEPLVIGARSSSLGISSARILHEIRYGYLVRYDWCLVPGSRVLV